MSLSAYFEVNHVSNVLRLEGTLNYEMSIPLNQNIREKLRATPIKNLIVDMKEVKFIGSTNIRNYFEILTSIAMDENIKVILTGVESNFLKVFKLFEAGQAILQFESSEEDAIKSLTLLH